MELLLADKFFGMCVERYKIKLRRDSGQPYPWTEDPILRDFRFTNVFREDDRTTRYIKKAVRDPLSQNIIEQNKIEKFNKIVERVVIARWFNRISTLQLIEDQLVGDWDTEEVRRRLTGVRPLVTGAFMLKTLSNCDKLTGLLESIDLARLMIPEMIPRFIAGTKGRGVTLEGAWEDLQSIPYLGAFMAHEVVQDLFYTPVLSSASDSMTWSSFGPGGTHGMSRIISGQPKMFNRGSATDQATMREAMIQLLEMSLNNRSWPQEWPKWNAHTVEFSCCEFDKYCRGQAGERLKRRYSQN